MGIGYLPQEMSIFRTSRSNRTSRPCWNWSAATPITAATGFEELLGDFFDRASAQRAGHGAVGGERRRVEIARCLASARPICCWMNPSPASTPSPWAIRGLVHDLKSRGIGVLITDHNVRETLRSLTAPISCMTAMC